MNFLRDFFNRIKLLKKSKYRLPKTIELLIDQVRGKTAKSSALSFLSEGALRELASSVIEVEQQQIPGCIVEAGCALGGSAIILSGAKSRTRPLFCYDVFGMIPPPSECDGADVHERYAEIASGKSKGFDGDLYYGYRDDLYEAVQANLMHYGYPVEDNAVFLIQGLYQDTLFLNDTVALAHIDCDWYESVLLCLNRVYPHLVRGSIIVIDDYDHFSGARKAVDQFLTDHKDDFIIRKRERLQLIKC